MAEAIETESSRRKRKCLEIVEEVMPGMELEVGVDEVCLELGLGWGRMITYCFRC